MKTYRNNQTAFWLLASKLKMRRNVERKKTQFSYQCVERDSAVDYLLMSRCRISRQYVEDLIIIDVDHRDTVCTDFTPSLYNSPKTHSGHKNDDRGIGSELSVWLCFPCGQLRCYHMQYNQFDAGVRRW